MIRYTCDLCKRDLDPQDELCYRVKIEIAAVFDPIEDTPDDDRDHLQEIHDMLERMQDVEDDEVVDEVRQCMTFDLCAECRRQFAKRPLGREHTHFFDFSQN